MNQSQRSEETTPLVLRLAVWNTLMMASALIAGANINPWITGIAAVICLFSLVCLTKDNPDPSLSKDKLARILKLERNTTPKD